MSNKVSIFITGELDTRDITDLIEVCAGVHVAADDVTFLTFIFTEMKEHKFVRAHPPDLNS